MSGDDDEYDTNELGVIPGDNSKPSDERWPGYPDAPVNLTKLPPNLTPTSKDLGGD